MAKQPTPALPGFMEQISHTRFALDPAVYFPAALEELEVAKADIDQYWLEVAYQMMKLDAQHAVRMAGVDPRPKKSLEFKVLNRPDWVLKNHPKGRGIEAASKGKEARGHFQRLRGFMPQ